MGEAEDDGNIEYYEDGEIASWKDVFAYCCYTMKAQWASITIHFALFLGLSYTFFAGIFLLAQSMQIAAGCSTSKIIESAVNPFSAVMAGFLLGAVFQSSFIVNNSIISSLVLSGVSPDYCLYMAMGNSVGSTITSSIIAMFHITDKNMLERAVAGASVNTLHQWLVLLILFPIELSSGALLRIADAIVPATPSMSYEWQGLFNKIISPATKLLIMPNISIFGKLAVGAIDSCTAEYPLSCKDDEESFSNCSSGLIACDPETDNCPLLFRSSASMKKDQFMGILAVFFSLSLIYVSLYLIVKLINRMLINNPVEVIAKLTAQNHYLIMLMGCGSGMLLVDTSVTECAFMPFVATGIFEIEQMFPWCIGSNLGCAATNAFIAYSIGGREYLLVALAHLLFNVLGTILWYPLPYLRQFPLHGALIVGIVARMWRIACLVHFVVTFIAVPILFTIIANMISSEKKVRAGLGWFLFVIFGIFAISMSYRWFFLQGREKFIAFFENPKERDSYDQKKDVDEESYYDDEDYTDDGSAVSSIGFGEPVSAKRKKNKRTLEVMRPKAITPPPARKRLIKNYGESKAENCGCCVDNALM